MPPRTAPDRGTAFQRGRGGGGRGRGRGEGDQGRGGRGGGFRGGGRGGPPGAFTGPPHQAATITPTAAPAVTDGQTNIARHIQSIIVRRPNYGQLSLRPLTVNVNAYEVTVPDELIRHYDVVIEPESESVAFNIKVIRHLQTEVAPEIFTPIAAFDGRKNMFAARDLPLGPTDSGSWTFHLRPPNPNARKPRPPYNVTIKKAATLNPQLLRNFLAGRQEANNSILATLQAFNIAIRTDVISRYPTNSKSFFVPANRRDIGGGVELWRGYFQSVRPGANRLLINVDVTSAMMYKSGPLLDVCLSFFDAQDPRMLMPRHGLTPRNIRALSNFLLNLPVRAIHNNRSRMIKGVSSVGARDLTFDFNGQRIDVATYYQLHDNRTLTFPDVVCAKVDSSGAMIPLELLVVPEGKIMKKELFQDKTREMVDFSRMRPADRFQEIRKGLDLLSFDSSPIVQHFGIKLVTTQPLSIPARLLPTPPLNYHSNSSQKTVRPSNGSWNMVDKKFYRPAEIRKWAVIIYENQRRFDGAAADRLVKDLVRGARARGMTVLMEQPLIKWCNGQGNVFQQLLEAGRECVARPPLEGKEGPGMFVVILPNIAGDIYLAIKHFGDVSKGIPTQCMQASKCVRANDQFWNNILLKINPKLGGINSILDPTDRGADFLKEPTIILGADVMHPPHSANQGIPSYASLVGSVDANAVKYVATSRAQDGKREDIMDLKTMCLEIFNKYKGYQVAVEKRSAQAASPKRLLFFRDGVSEGEFSIVKRQELDAIEAACREAKFKPKITFIVVGKRHHYRFCPQNLNDRNQADPKSGNCPAGMVVDQVITHPIDFDFYLLSHGGLIGTSRPSHYSVVHDENNFQADALQVLSFSLCHIFARATRSVSIPAPVYYAHLVCKRAKNHYDPRSGSDTASSAAGSAGLQDMRERYRPLHDNQAGNMYFM